VDSRLKALREENRKLEDGARQHARARLELFARLASIPSLNALSPQERQDWSALVRRTGFKLTTVLSWIREDDHLSQWGVLQYSHPLVRKVLNDLFNGEEVPLQQLAEHERTHALLGSSGILGWTLGNASLLEEMLISLWHLLTQGGFPILGQGRFPLRRCPQCKKTVFALKPRGRPQKYCSSACTNRANEKARRGTRGPYMRKHMAKKRKKAKQAIRKAR
jgi:hypothetical protein